MKIYVLVYDPSSLPDGGYDLPSGAYTTQELAQRAIPKQELMMWEIVELELETTPTKEGSQLLARGGER